MIETNLKRCCGIILVCLLLVGCTQVNMEEQTALEEVLEDKVSIEFIHIWSEQLFTSRYNVISEIVQDYMDKHPHIHINVQALDNEQYKDKLKIVSTSNSLPDVGVIWPAGYLQPYVDGRLFAPLDSIISDELNEETFITGTTDYFKINEKTYGLPLEFNISPIFYNKEIFEQYNLSIPQTYDELLATIQVLSEHDVIPIALGNKERWTGSLWYLYLAERFAGQAALNDALTGKDSFSRHEGLLKAAAEIQQLVNMEAFNKNFNGIKSDDAKLYFYNEKAAMYLMGTWELGNFMTNPDIPESFKQKIGFFNFPYDPSGQDSMDSWIGGPGVGLFVAEHSQVKEEAKKFVAFFVKEWGEKSVEHAGVIPATKVDTTNLKLPPLYYDILTEVIQANNLVLYADVLLEPDDAEHHLNQIQALFGLAITPEQFNEEHDSFLLQNNLK